MRVVPHITREHRLRNDGCQTFMRRNHLPASLFRHPHRLFRCDKILGVLGLPNWGRTGLKRDRPATLPRQPRTHLQQFELQSTLQPLTSERPSLESVHFCFRRRVSCSACPAGGVRCFAMCPTCLPPIIPPISCVDLSTGCPQAQSNRTTVLPHNYLGAGAPLSFVSFSSSPNSPSRPS